ncbi:MAG: DMT family transporter [Candidatus Vecturithrix sp.]|jgi:drug/metabolite transporter (DMT)-like permease|nr:DMT family transporter [Candidatus Vecturithrix sp.]
MPFLGELSALGAASLWAVTSMIFAKVTVKIGSVQANIARMMVATLLFAISVVLFRLPINLSFTQIQYLFVSAMLGLVFGDTYLFKGFQTIGARLSMLIMSLSPAIAAFLAYLFLGETLSIWGIFGIFLTLCGVALVVFDRTGPVPALPLNRIGILYALMGAFGQGAGLIFAKLAFTEGPIHGMVASAIRIASAVLVLLPLSLLRRRTQNPLTVLRQDRTIFLCLLTASVFGTYLGITLSLVAVAYAKVGIASTLIATSPVLMLPIVRLAYHDRLSWKAVAGAFLAITGVAILFLT